MEQTVDNRLVVPSLDVPVPQMENQLVEVSRQLNTHSPEQAQDLLFIPSSLAPCALRGADGRTAGGSADDQILFFPIAADYGAER